MIKLQVIQNCSFGVVMDELGALIEKSGVVLVGLDHKKPGICHAGGSTEVFRYAADEKTGMLSGSLKDPGEHGRRSCFPMGPGDCEHPLRGQNVLRQPLRAGDVRLAAVEDFLN